jgi:ketosteroid isomerase-like protein
MGENTMFARRQFTLAAAVPLAAAMLGVASSAAASNDEASVKEAVESFRKAMMTGDGKALDALLLDGMTYGHSTGRVQTKSEFIADATSGKSVWKSITLSDQTVGIVGNSALVRCVFTGQNESQGKTNNVHFGLLMIWNQVDGRWRLLARQGYKI